MSDPTNYPHELPQAWRARAEREELAAALRQERFHRDAVDKLRDERQAIIWRREAVIWRRCAQELEDALAIKQPRPPVGPQVPTTQPPDGTVVRTVRIWNKFAGEIIHTMVACSDDHCLRTHWTDLGNARVHPVTTGNPSTAVTAEPTRSQESP